MQRAQSDVPAPAYAKAVRALDEFDARAVEYAMLVDTERALLRDGNFAGISETVTRADFVAREAAVCGSRVSALRSEVERGAFKGGRVTDLKRRFAAARRRSEELHALSEGLVVEFARARDATSAELGAAVRGSSVRAAAGYGAQRRPLALDKTA